MARAELQPLPHREAIEYFRSKGYAHELQRFHHLDHWREDHARNWVVAKAMRDDVSLAIRQEFDRALTEGRTLAEFQADLAPRLQRMGWWGKAEMEDPVTGELEEVQLGSMHRLRTIFDTNMRTAHAAGHWASIQRTKRAFPYLHYIQIQRPTKRHDHARFHDKIWRVDDPIWLRIYPPNGYFCGCIVTQRTEGWMRRNGRTVSDPMDLDEEDWTHKRSGEVHRIPRGITPGFDTNPGAAWLDLGEDWERMTPDLTGDQRAAQRGMIEGLRLRRLSDGRETLILSDKEGQPISYRTADPDHPESVSLGGLTIPHHPHILHSHLSETTLSQSDLAVLFDTPATSITAISPGGSIWRAVRTPNIIPRHALGEFAAKNTGLQVDGVIYNHARWLWLEKKGVITYSWRTSEKARQFLRDNADLIQRLTDDPAP